ncbi:ATP-binding protein [uncultured Sutterella sp.]|uniref:DEAD/DEAH box helicase n=1 Tax=uncultured Sutterella sp. TaxID=286133 RepID=UPI002627C6E6|nr:ATP-binding protein [uncultured Sutterella sp.]
MESRAAQLEILRFWEEIELLTPEDFRRKEAEGTFWSEWRPGRFSGNEAEAVERWQSMRLHEAYEYPARAPRTLLEADLPFFTVYLGVVEKRAVYRQLLREFSAIEGKESGESSADHPAFAGSMDSIWGEMSSSSIAGSDLRGQTYLARFQLNPWGKYIDESFEAAGFCGALRYLRAEKARLREAEDLRLVEGALLRCERMARWMEAEVARVCGQSADCGSGLAVRAEQIDGDPVMICLTDPMEDAEPVAEGFICELSDQLARGAGLPEGLSCVVRTTLSRPLRRRPPEPGPLRSFYLADIRAARVALMHAGASPILAPDMERLRGLDSGKASEAEDASEEKLQSEVPANAAGQLSPEDLDFLQPVSGPLARLLALGSGKDVRRTDLLKSPAALSDLLKPEGLPSGRWPADPSHHLYLAQQAAVSGILRAGEGFGPLVSVNGPPGTGKSWLLRDIIAEIVTRRARRIAEKNSSRDVFDWEHPVVWELSANRIDSLTPVKAGIAEDSLMVVASNNNAAIRNITDSLPRSYGLRDPKPDPSTGGTRPAFSYWRDCALGMMALAVEMKPLARTGKKGRSATQGHGGASEDDDPNLSFEDGNAGPSDLSREEWQKLPAAKRRQMLRETLLKRVKSPEEVWGLSSATLGSRRNCGRFVQAVMGIGMTNPFGSTIQQQIDDVLDQLDLMRRLPEEDWLSARKRFRELDEKVRVRRERMAERCRTHRVVPQVFSTPLAEDPSQHKLTLWVDEEFERLRSELFEAAMELHAATLVAQADAAKKGLRAAAGYLLAGMPHFESGSARQVFEFLSFLIPVISTTLASAGRLFAQVGSSELPWVFIDEASQASPQAAVGILNRARRAVVLGDLRQLMPVVTMPEPLAEFLRGRHPLVDEVWSPMKSSLQSLADASMEAGTSIRDSVSHEDVWTGLPLRTHRRCLSPMFEIANALSYAGQMVQMTPRVDDGRPAQSCWYDIVGKSYVPPVRVSKKGRRTQGAGGDPKMIREEMAWLRKLLMEFHADRLNRGLSVFVLSPFRAVAEGAGRIIRELGLRDFNARAGTVHTFQGQEADVVILVLGSIPGSKGRRQRRWASMPANLLNVAVTRARRDLIVIGDWGEWTLEPAVGILAGALPRKVEYLEPGDYAFNADEEAMRAALAGRLFGSETPAKA